MSTDNDGNAGCCDLHVNPMDKQGVPISLDVEETKRLMAVLDAPFVANDKLALRLSRTRPAMTPPVSPLGGLAT
jgi:hypothetical protein